MTFFVNNLKEGFFIENIDENIDLALEHFAAIFRSKDSFLGIKTETSPIQFMCEDNNKWLVDIPYDMKNFYTLQRYADYEECVGIIKKIFNGLSPLKIDGLIEVNLKRETLEQVLSKK